MDNHESMKYNMFIKQCTNYLLMINNTPYVAFSLG